jgi:membrane protease YdiL (CAAX protease family)
LLEEIGWRGFALPRLQAKFGPLAGTLILAFVWAAWHDPQHMIRTGPRRTAASTRPDP